MNTMLSVRMYADDVFHPSPPILILATLIEREADRETDAFECLHGFIVDPSPPVVARNTAG